jgi:uncharacterized protein YvpB
MAKKLSNSKKESKGKKPAVKNTKSKFIGKLKKVKIKEKVHFEVPHYPQTEEFTSSAACAMMVLKYIDPEFKFRKENEYSIWQEAVNGSVWHGSKYGIAYALSKRGAKVGILSNTKDEGYDKKMAVYENVNLDTLAASFNEIRQKSVSSEVDEDHGVVTAQTIKKALSANYIPIVLIDANLINSYLDSSPHWVVVKGYDKDAFYINDPYSDSTITIDADAFKSAIGFESNTHMIFSDSKAQQKK